MAPEISRRMGSILESVEQEAARLREEARVEAERYLDDARRHADALVAERQRRIAELSDELLRKSEAVVARLDDAIPVRQGFENLVRALGGAAERLSGEVDDTGPQFRPQPFGAPPAGYVPPPAPPLPPAHAPPQAPYGGQPSQHPPPAPGYPAAQAPPPAFPAPPANGEQSFGGPTHDPLLYQPAPTPPIAYPQQAAWEPPPIEAPAPAPPPSGSQVYGGGPAAHFQPTGELRYPPPSGGDPAPASDDQPQPQAAPQPPSQPSDHEQQAGSTIGSSSTSSEWREVDARMVTIQMASSGSTRSEVGDHLRTTMDIASPETLLDEVFGAGTGGETRVPWAAGPA